MALKKEWAEGQRRVVTLEEVEAGEMRIYLQFLYTGKIVTGIDEKTGDEYPLLAALYGLSERVLDRKFQNRVIDAFLANSRTSFFDNDMEVEDNRYDCSAHYYPGESAVTQLYRLTTTGSPARRLMVDYFVLAGTGTWVTSIEKDKVDSEALMEFLLDLSAAALDKLNGSVEGWEPLEELERGVPKSYYHEVPGEQGSKATEGK